MKFMIFYWNIQMGLCYGCLGILQCTSFCTSWSWWYKLMVSGPSLSYNWQICCYVSQQGNQSKRLEYHNYLVYKGPFIKQLNITKLLPYSM